MLWHKLVAKAVPPEVIAHPTERQAAHHAPRVHMRQDITPQFAWVAQVALIP